MLVKSWQAEKIIEINWSFIEKRKVGMWEYWLFILWVDKQNLNKQKLQDFKDLCKKENALFFQIEILDYNNLQSFNNLNSLLNIRIDSHWFNKWYYKKFITSNTAIIDLEQTEDEILMKMKPKGRYNIKLATKKLVTIKEVEKTAKNIDKYYRIMQETTSRDKFSWNTLEYYSIFLNTLKSSKLLLAYCEEKVIAWWIFIFDNNVSIYYYGASTSDKKYRNLMAPYLLQWEAIKIARNNWSKIYDFLWIAKQWEKNSSLIWVTNFKLKLTKDTREVSTSYIYINKKIKYFLIDVLRKIKNN